MKRILYTAAVLSAACLTGCGSAAQNEDTLAGKTFYYDGEGFGGPFKIELKENGKFEYYEGALSSYIGAGKWAVSNDTLTLKDENTPKLNETDPNLVNHFQIDGDTLRFIEKDSSNFLYVRLKDGEAFHAG